MKFLKEMLQSQKWWAYAQNCVPNLGIGIGRVPKVTQEATRRAEEEEDCGDGSCDATVLLEKPF